MNKLINKSDTIDAWTEHTVDSMDMKTLVELVYELTYEYLDKMSEAELIDYIDQFDPDFLKGHIEGEDND